MMAIESGRRVLVTGGVFNRAEGLATDRIVEDLLARVPKTVEAETAAAGGGK